MQRYLAQALLALMFISVVIQGAVATEMDSDMAPAGSSEPAGDLYSQFYNQLKFLTQRDRIISKNIANSDTPRYLPQELKRRPNPTGNFGLKRTNDRHMSVDEPSNDFEMAQADIQEIKPNGNAVSVEQEMFKKAENSIRLQETANMYQRSRELMRTAIASMK
jgi:flagellar basal-body rod protein FlgB